MPQHYYDGEFHRVPKHNDVMVHHNKHGEREAFIWKEREWGPRWERFTTHWGDYLCGYTKPNHPMPAIPYEIHWDGYAGIIYVQNPNTPDDWDYAWDSWGGELVRYRGNP